ncbi:MAG: ATP-binding protein [Desulfobulbaceae bacterium]|nr:ATP-binding protein [Desulfobulbaceae bacterium]
MTWPYLSFDKTLLLLYHSWEECFIAFACFLLSIRAAKLFRQLHTANDCDEKSRALLTSISFAILGASSAFHAIIHGAAFDNNLLYHSLVNYCLGLTTLIFANSGETPRSGRPFIFLFVSLLIFLVPDVYEHFPHFGEFRPLLWISIAYLAGVAAILYIASFYRSRHLRTLWCAIGFTLICISSIFLFFPSSIGSAPWLHGHFFRPIGFLILLISFNENVIHLQGGSVLNRILASFSLLVAFPLLIFGTIISYENFDSIDLQERQLLIFLLLLTTLCSVLFFGFRMVIRLILPILRLKEAVSQYADSHVLKVIVEIGSKDEIADLSRAFTEMVKKLDMAFEEKERLCRLAASGELAATLAHEIKNPLNAIGGAATYIGKNYKGQLIEEFVKVITDEVGRINKLATSLMNFATPITPQFEQCDLNRIVTETLLLLAQDLQEQEVEIIKDFDHDLPKVHCDASQIKQVLINLLINAFDAVDARGKVTVVTRCQAGKIFLIVKDNGRGISEENLKQIFNPFFTTRTRGTGLGLAISKKVALANNGDLQVESLQGKGCTFTLTLQGGN